MYFVNKFKVSLLFFLPFLLYASNEVDTSEAITGDWGGARTKLKEQGLDFKSVLTLDDSWNVAGGKRISPWYGRPEYLLNLGIEIDTNYYFHHEGGTFYIQYSAHGGLSPSVLDVGSYNYIDNIEAPPFNALYECWYKETFNKNQNFFFSLERPMPITISHKHHIAVFF